MTADVGYAGLPVETSLFQHSERLLSFSVPRLPSVKMGTHRCMIYLYIERQGSELHMVKKEEGQEKQQPTRPKPAPSRSIADPLAAGAWSLPASIDQFPP